MTRKIAFLALSGGQRKGRLWVMHNGEDMMRYPDHGPGKDGLVRDVCLGLMHAGLTLREPAAPPLAVAPY